MITVTDHERLEWARAAQAMYAAGRNRWGHWLSAAAALPWAFGMPVDRYDELQRVYREWLIDGTIPPL